MLGRLIAVGRRKFIDNIDELVQERLAFNAKKKMLEIVIRQVGSAAGMTTVPLLEHARFLLPYNVGLRLIVNGCYWLFRFCSASSSAAFLSLLHRYPVSSPVRPTTRWQYLKQPDSSHMRAQLPVRLSGFKSLATSE